MEIGVTQTSSGKLSVVNESAGNNHWWPVGRGILAAQLLIQGLAADPDSPYFGVGVLPSGIRVATM